MAVQRRSILGKPNPLDNGLPPASYVSGGDSSLDSDPYIAPVNVTDQSSASTAAERTGLDDAYRESARITSEFVGDGAAGMVLRRGADSFTTSGHIDGTDPAATVGEREALVTRTAGSDAGGGFGKAI